MATTSAAGGVQGQFIDLQVSIKQLHHIWLQCVFPSQQPTTDVTSALQHTSCDESSYVDRDLSTSQTGKIWKKKFLSVWSVELWNSLPLTVRDVSLTLTQFCAQLKTVLFSRAYGTSS